MEKSFLVNRQEVEMLAEAVEWMLETDQSRVGEDRVVFKRFARRVWDELGPLGTYRPECLLCDEEDVG